MLIESAFNFFHFLIYCIFKNRLVLYDRVKIEYIELEYGDLSKFSEEKKNFKAFSEFF